MNRIITTLAAFLALALALAAEAKPLKVFILAGQSNIEGHAKVETFDYIGDDPATAPLLKQMRDADSQARVCEGAWISYWTGGVDNSGEGYGKLTAGYHYLGCAKTFALMGRAFAQANLDRLEPQRR